MKKNYELVGIEVPIFMNIQEGVQLKSFLDVVMRNKISGKNHYLSLTSKFYQPEVGRIIKRKTLYKKSQLFMYKQFYSLKSLMFHLIKLMFYFLILKRKIATKEDGAISSVTEI